MSRREFCQHSGALGAGSGPSDGRLKDASLSHKQTGRTSEMGRNRPLGQRPNADAAPCGPQAGALADSQGGKPSLWFSLGNDLQSVSYTHLTLPTSDLV